MSFPATPPSADLPARDRILLTAHDLFYRDGIRATGIDKIIASANVTKVTFYRHFCSKNALICAYLDYRHTRWMSWFTAAINRHSALQGADLLVLIPVLQEWFDNPVYRGCAFINGVAELGTTLPEAHAICVQHKQDMQRVITPLLPDTPQRNALASAAALAVDGAIFKAQLEAGFSTTQYTSLDALLVLLQALQASATR